MKEGIPTTQRAWQQIKRGKPKDVLRLVQNAPVSRPKPDEVMVKVHSAALNPVGYRMMGTVPSPIARFPGIPESDFAGVIVDMNGHNEWAVGQEVIGFFDPFKKLRSGQGALAQYVNIASDHIIAKPAKVPFSQAAGMPIVCLTAYEGLVKHGKLVAGDRVFINGGSSAVGAMAIQIAKQRGATVVASCSEAKREFVEGLGADLVVDYTASPLVSQLAKMEPFDLVFDCIGVLSLYHGSAKFLKPKRLYLNIGLDLHGLSTAQAIGAFLRLFRLAYLPGFMGGAGRKIQIYSTVWDQKALVELAEMVAAGQIHVPIDGEYGWEKEDVMKAYERQMSARARGKIIIQMQRET